MIANQDKSSKLISQLRNRITQLETELADYRQVIFKLHLNLFKYFTHFYSLRKKLRTEGISEFFFYFREELL